MKLVRRDCLIVGYDSTEEKDLTGLSIGRKTENGIEIINTVFGEKAEKLYNYLTGKAEIK